MKEEYSRRFGDAPWANKSQKIVVGGAGGIGSWTCLALARAGHQLFVYDMDTVDQNNIGGQLYGPKHIGKKKTEALDEMIKLLADVRINQFDKFTEDSFASPITVSAFDNMAARQAMFKVWKEQPDKKVFIDGRCTAEYFEVFCVQSDEDIELYEKEYLFDDGEANELPCSFKASTHNSMGIAYQLTGALNNVLSEIPIRPVHFRTRSNIALFLYEFD
jgi:hypothetical protein